MPALSDEEPDPEEHAPTHRLAAGRHAQRLFWCGRTKRRRRREGPRRGCGLLGRGAVAAADGEDHDDGDDSDGGAEGDEAAAAELPAAARAGRTALVLGTPPWRFGHRFVEHGRRTGIDVRARGSGKAL
jgi:hypothetical protein